MLTDSEYYLALKRIRELFYLSLDTHRKDELNKLVSMIIEYEKRLLEE